MTRAAIVRLRDACTAAELVAAEAANALTGRQPDLHAALIRIAHARQVLRVGVQQSIPGNSVHSLVDDLTSPVPPHIVRHDADGLVLALPTLVRKGCRSYDDLEAAWASDGRCWSSGEQHAAYFVRHVVAGEPFDLAAAVTVWDDPHLAVFRAWARDPWTGWG